MRQIILDTETTGLNTVDGHRIIEIGCIELVNRHFTGKNFQVYLNPQRHIDDGAVAVHGLTADFLADKPPFKAIAQEFLEYITGAEIVAHNANFDIGFLNYELSLLPNKQKITEHVTVIDSLEIARKLHPGQRNSLDALCRRYKIDNTKRNFHGALLDAQLLAEVYLAMTGGQATLFDEAALEATYQESPMQTTNTQNTSKRKLKVLNARPEEIALHDAYLAKLKAKNHKN